MSSTCDNDSKSYTNVKNLYVGIEMETLDCVGHNQKRVGTRLRNLNKNVKRFGVWGRLTDATTDCLQNFVRVVMCQNGDNSKKMKSNLLASLVHVAPSNDNNVRICKYNAYTYASVMHKNSEDKTESGLPCDIVYKIRPIYYILNKETELEECLQDKTQNANESFDWLYYK